MFPALVGPSHPRDVVVTVISSFAIHVKWNEPVQPNGVIAGYVISYGTSKDSLLSESRVTGNTFERTIDNLRKFTTYYITVRGRTTKIGNASRVLNATTFEYSK